MHTSLCSLTLAIILTLLTFNSVLGVTTDCSTLSSCITCSSAANCGFCTATQPLYDGQTNFTGACYDFRTQPMSLCNSTLWTYQPQNCVYRIPCSNWKTCESCAAARTPVSDLGCGWCAKQQACYPVIIPNVLGCHLLYNGSCIVPWKYSNSLVNNSRATIDQDVLHFSSAAVIVLIILLPFLFLLIWKGPYGRLTPLIGKNGDGLGSGAEVLLQMGIVLLQVCSFGLLVTVLSIDIYSKQRWGFGDMELGFWGYSVVDEKRIEGSTYSCPSDLNSFDLLNCRTFVGSAIITFIFVCLSAICVFVNFMSLFYDSTCFEPEWFPNNWRWEFTGLLSTLFALYFWGLGCHINAQQTIFIPTTSRAPRAVEIGNSYIILLSCVLPQFLAVLLWYFILSNKSWPSSLEKPSWFLPKPPPAVAHTDWRERAAHRVEEQQQQDAVNVEMTTTVQEEASTPPQPATVIFSLEARVADLPPMPDQAQPSAPPLDQSNEQNASANNDGEQPPPYQPNDD